jgi:hypothetical protein
MGYPIATGCQRDLTPLQRIFLIYMKKHHLELQENAYKKEYNNSPNGDKPQTAEDVKAEVRRKIEERRRNK